MALDGIVNMSNLAVIASLVLFSGGGNSADVTKMVTTQASGPVTITASATPVRVESGTESASEILDEAQKAISIQQRRDKMEPGIQDRVVKKEKTKTDKVLILGGKEAFPM